ncbi:TPA: hypothetical protein U1348_000736 [Streptococcus suis]|nr:hypothetical protein [Streptococcus suis]HEM5229267.1 hypothetical protein [Streptococcus suis]HEM5231562.1 hypothetical protein [Streptococcus suis]
MKKSFFIRTFNLNTNLFILASLTGLLGWTLNFLAITLNQTLPVTLDLSQVSLYLGLGSHYCYLAMSILLFVLAVLVTVEIVNRVRYDSLSNYFKSIFHTFKFRNFLTQWEKSEKVTTIDNQTITTYNPINGSFNRCAHKSVIDIRKDEIKGFIKVPRDQQGQKVLVDMLSQLKEEVSSQHPNYYFSAPNRIRNNLWLVGKRR